MIPLDGPIAQGARSGRQWGNARGIPVCIFDIDIDILTIISTHPTPSNC